MKTIMLSILGFYLLIGSSAYIYSQKNIIYIIKIDGTINPVTAEFIHESIEKAKTDSAQCLIVQINTPGGLLKSTRVIVSDILESPIPIIVYVYPPGSQSASAGVFITLSAHIAVMTPGTNMGSAHPVIMSEGDQKNKKDSADIMMEKMTNDAAAFMRSIAEKRHRNIEWAEEAVRKSVSVTESEALKLKIIDYVSPNIDSLLLILNEKEVETSKGKVIIHTRDAQIIPAEMSFAQKFLDILSDPNIAYILLMIGIYGLLFELYNPGSILPGIVGFISIILAFYALHSLPLNYAGLALIIFAVILFILEIKIISHGLLTLGGIISFLIGSLMLIKPTISFEFVQISLSVIITVTVLTSLFFIFALGKGIMAQRKKPVTGIQGMIGLSGITISSLNPKGQIQINGEIWQAESEGEEISSNSEVIVTKYDNLELKVKSPSTGSRRT